jgi:hypothetical protein
MMVFPLEGVHVIARSTRRSLLHFGGALGPSRVMEASVYIILPRLVPVLLAPIVPALVFDLCNLCLCVYVSIYICVCVRVCVCVWWRCVMVCVMVCAYVRVCVCVCVCVHHHHHTATVHRQTLQILLRPRVLFMLCYAAAATTPQPLTYAVCTSDAKLCLCGCV